MMPCLLVITWRGYEGKDAPEHLVMGEAMPAILDAMHIPWRALGTGRPRRRTMTTQWAQCVRSTRRPDRRADRQAGGCSHDAGGGASDDARRGVRGAARSSAATRVCANGFISRWVCALGDDEANFT